MSSEAQSINLKVRSFHCIRVHSNKVHTQRYLTRAAASAGIQLLQKMGWRQGRGIGKLSSHQKAQPGSKWGPMLSVSVDNVEIHRLSLKDDTHGLGYDPFKASFSDLTLFYMGRKPSHNNLIWAR